MKRYSGDKVLPALREFRKSRKSAWSDNVPISYILLILHQYHTIRGAYCFTFLFLDFLLDRHYTYYTHLAYIAHIASYRFISLPYRYHIYITWYVVTCPHIAGVQYTAISQAVIFLYKNTGFYAICQNM